LIAAGIAVGMTFAVVHYVGEDENSKMNNGTFDRYYEGDDRHHHHNRNGGLDRNLPRGFQHPVERGLRNDDDSASSDPGGFEDKRHGFGAYKRTKKMKKGGYPDDFGRRDFGPRNDDDGNGNGGGFMKQRKAAVFSQKRVQVGEVDDYDVNMDILDDNVAAKFRKDLINSHRNAHEAEKILDGILDASIHLVGLSKSNKLKYSADGSYNGVIAEFCKLDFQLHKDDPSKYPMFRFIVQNSQDCRVHKTNFDLRKLAYLTRWYDEKIAKNPSGEGPKVLNITAVAFHESRCGSTLVANSMIAMDPVKHRTYSEAAPPIKAYFICDDNFETCSQQQSVAILKDTMYMMSRTDDHREERVFFKFQSMISTVISTFQMAFPDVPWMYVYREPVQVLMSHYKDDPTMKRTICTKFRRSPSRDMYRIAEQHGRRGPQDLAGIEFCAAHISVLTESAVNNLNDMAIPVAYDQLPNALWEKIMPKIFGRPLEQFEIDNLEAISKSYSKAGTHADRKGEYKDDSKKKAEHAPDEVRDAAKEFLQESFDALAAYEPILLK